jgi:hypothetical protein
MASGLAEGGSLPGVLIPGRQTRIHTIGGHFPVIYNRARMKKTRVPAFPPGARGVGAGSTVAE